MPILHDLGGISSQGRGSLYFVPQNATVNTSIDLTILKDKLPVWSQLLHCNYFHQDGAPSHRAKAVREFLKQSNINVLSKRPGNSPDLNCLENYWAKLKNIVATFHPTSRVNLVNKIKFVWSHYITRYYCQELLHSMPRRIQACLKAKGYPTRY